jgi:hypothetical protein
MINTAMLLQKKNKLKIILRYFKQFRLTLKYFNFKCNTTHNKNKKNVCAEKKMVKFLVFNFFFLIIYELK